MAGWNDAAQGRAMHLTEVDKGRWRAKVSIGRDPVTGKYRQASKTFRARNITEARRQAKTWAENLRPDPSGATFNQLLDRWLTDVERDPSTTRGYVSKANHWIRPGLGHLKVVELDRRRLTAWRAGLAKTSLAPRSRNQCIAIVKAAIRWGAKTDWEVDRAAADVLSAYRIDQPNIEPPSPADVIAVLTEAIATDETFGLMLWLTAVTGCRRGELAGLRWEDFDGATLRIRRAIDQSGQQKTTKTRQQRVVTLDEGTCALLEEHRRQEVARWQAHTGLSATRREGWMFPSPLDWDKPRSVDSLSHRLADLRGDRNVWLHGLRHAVATVLIAAGVNPRTVSARLGHAKTSMTLDVYTAPVTDADREAARVMADHLRALMGPSTQN